MNSSDQPWFSVGEEVILQSRYFPQYNGEYVIHSIIKPGDFATCRLTGVSRQSTIPRTVYLLDTPFPHPLGFESPVGQSALRKKHKPSDESFGELMNNLKSVTV